MGCLYLLGLFFGESIFNRLQALLQNLWGSLRLKPFEAVDKDKINDSL
jgi:hypothetical protein